MLPDERDYLRYSPIHLRPRLKWPEGARVAIWIVPNIEVGEYVPPRSPFRDQWPRTPHPDTMTHSFRESSLRTGFWRLLSAFDQHAFPITASLNVAVLQRYPEVRQAMVERGWELMSHGIYNTRYLYGLTPDEERRFYREVAETIRNYTGQQVKGMLGPALSSNPNTPALMAEAGMIYTADWFVDDQPFPINVSSGVLVGVPYSRLINDAFLFGTGAWMSNEEFVQMCKDQFDVLYEEGAESGRVMCIALHPYLIGQPHRIDALHDVLRYISSFPAVWAATGSQIAEWYIEHHLEDHRRHLEDQRRDRRGA